MDSIGFLPGWQRKALLPALLLASPLAWPQIDISNRTFIQQGVAPESVAAGVWSVMGRGEPKAVFGDFTNARFDAHPVIVNGPWNGSPYLNLNIAPPAIGSYRTEEFGAAVAIQGFRIAVGSPSERGWSEACSTSCFCCYVDDDWLAGGGKVRLYLYNGAAFAAERTIVFGGLEDRFGAALALEPSTLLVGSPGAVPGGAHLFDPGTGTLIDSFYSPDATGADLFASAVALDDDLAFIGAPGSDTVYVYRDDGAGNWSAAGALESPGPGSEFGASIAADGDRVIVGAPGVDSAYVFEDDGDAVWPVAATLSGTADSDFGRAVAITADTAFVSAPRMIAGPIRVGSVDRYDRQPGGSWTLTTQLTSASPADDNNFGAALAASTALLTVMEPGRRGQYVYTSPSRIYDPDGDGVSYLQDNCHDLVNPDQQDIDDDGLGDACDDDIDGDGLGNEEEVIGGTDPENYDTDGDGHSDLTDDYPLDGNDGWLKVARFPGEVEQLALGESVLLATTTDGDALRAFAEGADGWEEVPAPVINRPAGSWLQAIEMKRDRAAIYVRHSGTYFGELYLFEWSADTGWSELGSAGLPEQLFELALDGDRVAVRGSLSSDDIARVFEASGGNLLEVATLYPSFIGSDNMLVSGDRVIISRRFSGFYIYEAGDGFTEQFLEETPDVRVGDWLLDAGDGSYLIGGSRGTVYRIEYNGSWTFTPTGIEPDLEYDADLDDVSDNGLLAISNNHPFHDFESDIHVIRLADSATIGLLQADSPNLDYEINDRVVVRSRDGMLDIFYLDGDGDGVLDANDNCPTIANPDQLDDNNDGIGNACQPVGC